MTRPRAGLRIRIAATVAAIVVVAVAALGVAVHVLVAGDRVDRARSAADEQMRAALAIYDEAGLLAFDARVDDPRLPLRLQEAVTDDGDRATLVEGGATRTLWAAGRRGDELLSTRTTFRVADGEVRAVDRALVLAGAVTAAVAILVGLLSAGRIARRLRLAAATAREVARGGDSGSLRRAVGGGRDEVSDLADAVDAMADRLDARVRSEQRFTADVAHDLRTPVTGLVTAAGLLEESRAAEMVRDRAAALAALVEDLLEVARLDEGLETASLESVHVADLVAQAVARGVAAGEIDPDLVTVTTRPGPPLLTEARRLDRVLSNLVRNALRHGAPPVEVVQEGHRIAVRDHGDGFDADLLRDGPRRLRRGGSGVGGERQGNGLGLVIAAGQAAVLGARLDIDNAPEGGAIATVELPPAAPHDHLTTGSRDRGRTGRRP